MACSRIATMIFFLTLFTLACCHYGVEEMRMSSHVNDAKKNYSILAAMNRDREVVSEGTCTAISPSKCITCFHNVVVGNSIVVRYGPDNAAVAKIFSSSPLMDWAIVSINRDVFDPFPLKLAKPEIGMTVFGWTNQYGIGHRHPVYWEGIIVNYDKENIIVQPGVAPGASGSAIYSLEDGSFVGIVDGIIEHSGVAVGVIKSGRILMKAINGAINEKKKQSSHPTKK